MVTPTNLSRREREIMEIVFSLEKATLGEILARMDDAPTRPALRSLLTILEGKGHLRHTKASREFVYEATVEKTGAGKSALRRVLDVFFGGSLEGAMQAHFANPRELPDAEELAGLEKLIASAKERQATIPKKSKGKSKS